MKRFYELLGVEENATIAEIKKAYQRAARKYHPDKQQGKTEAEIEMASKMFVDIKAAYECLSDEARRAEYDESGDPGEAIASNPAEELLLHIFNELAPVATTVAGLLAQSKKVLGDLLDASKSGLTTQRSELRRLERLMKAVAYKGKNVNLLVAVIQEKIHNTQDEIQSLEDAGVAGQAALELLNEYEGLDRYDTVPTPKLESKKASELLRHFLP